MRTQINIICNILVRFTPMLAAFFMMPFIIKTVGKDAFGAWVLASSFVGIAVVFDLGFCYTQEKEIARIKVKDFPGGVCDFWFSTLSFQIKLCSFILILSFLLIQGMSHWMKIPASLKKEIFDLQWLFVVFTFGKYWINNFQSILRGLERHYVYFVFNLVYVVLYVFLLCILLQKGSSIQGLLVSDLLASLVFMALFVGYLVKELHFNFKTLKRVHIGKEVFHYSVNAFALQICALLLFSSGKLMLGAITGVMQVASYEIGVKIFNVLRNIFDQIARVFLPKVAAWGEGKREREIGWLIESGTLHLYALWGIFAVPLLVVVKDFIFLWLGTEFNATASIAYVLILASGFITLSRMSLNILMGLGIVKCYAQIRVLSMVVYVILGFFLIKWHTGIGAAAAMLIYSILFELTILIYSFRKFRMSFFMFLVTKLSKVLFLQCLIGAITWIIYGKLPLSYVSILAAFSVFTFLYGLSYWFFVFSMEERSDLKCKITEFLIRI